MKLLFAFLLLVSVATGWAQGSLGGGGAIGVGGGGGFGGGGGGQMDESSRDPSLDIPELFRRPVEEGWPIDWQTRTAILSPGDRVQYKVKLATDEVLLAIASSTNFDPALEVVLKNAKVATNDDRIEGDQSSFINFRASTAGEYTLSVVSYSKSAGGQFSLQLLVLNREDLRLDRPTEGQRRRVRLHRVTLEKGKTYQFAEDSNTYPSDIESIIGPSGNRVEDYDLISPTRFVSNRRRVVFTALKAVTFC